MKGDLSQDRHTAKCVERRDLQLKHDKGLVGLYARCSEEAPHLSLVTTQFLEIRKLPGFRDELHRLFANCSLAQSRLFNQPGEVGRI